MSDVLEGENSPERQALDAKIAEVKDFLKTSELGPNRQEHYQAELDGNLSVKMERDREADEHPDYPEYEILLKDALELCRRAGNPYSHTKLMAKIFSKES